MMHSRKKTFLSSAALALVSLSSAVAMAEVVLRSRFPVGVGKSIDHRIPHPVFGWALEPKASFRVQMREDTVRVRYSAAGWRDLERTVDNPRDAFRYVVLGDSFMEGYSVDLEASFHRRIEALARRDRIEAEAINLSAGGYGTLQEYLVFRDVGRGFAPDIVLLAFYLGNDVRNNSLALESRLGKNSIKAKSRPFLDPSDTSTWRVTQVDYDGAWQRYRAAKAKQDSWLKRAKNRSALVQATVAAMGSDPAAQRPRRRSRGDSAGRRAADVERQLARNFALYGVNYCQEPAEYSQAWTTTSRILARLRDEVQGAGSRLVVFTVPALHEVSEEALRDPPDRELICWQESPAYARLDAILRDLEIEHIDLLEHFRQGSEDAPYALFHKSDRHWNESGHALAAGIVHSALKERGYLPECSASPEQLARHCMRSKNEEAGSG